MSAQLVHVGHHYKAFDIVGQDLIKHHVDVRVGVVFERKVPQNTLEDEIELVVEFGKLRDHVEYVFASIQWTSCFFFLKKNKNNQLQGRHNIIQKKTANQLRLRSKSSTPVVQVSFVRLDDHKFAQYNLVPPGF